MIFKAMLLFIAVGSALGSVAMADSSLNVDLSQRISHVGQTDETRLQGRIRIGFVLDARGIVEVVGVMDSGNYNTPWATEVSDKPFKEQVPLAFKNIYLRKAFSNAVLEAGALPGEYEVGSAGTPSSGWTDGVQVTLKADKNIGNFRVIAGSLGSFNNANFFDRQFTTNFIEIEMSKEVFLNECDKLITKTAIQDYKGELYIKENLEFDLQAVGNKIFKLFADALFDTTRQAVNFELGTEFDVLKNFVGQDYADRLDVKVYFVDEDSRIPDRSKMIPLFLTYGPQGVIYLSGKIDKKGVVSWFLRAAAGSEERIDAGLTVKMPQLVTH